MTQQLWYTWSTSGYGSANGFRVRAATPELTKVEGPRVRGYIPLLGYKLSDATDGYLPPDQAPLCLAFLKVGSSQEIVLIQKIYIGLDPMRRPGNFFSHLLSDLPPVSSPSFAGQIPFSAREAISFWRSSLWRSAEGDWAAGELRLNPIPFEELFSYAYTGPLNGQSVSDTSSLFKKAFSAFLTLAHQNEGKRLYLVGQPEIVATLIWGITHALPRTLPIMQNLTFSTFEANVEADTKPLIIGTCWQPEYLKNGYANVPMNLNIRYYEPNNPYGIAIHCTTLESTSFNVPTTLTPHLSEYLQFIQDCFAGGPSGLTTLFHFLTNAEKRDISDLLREKYFPEPLWHRSLLESWQHAIEFQNTFISLKRNLNKTANVPDIASLYQPAFDPLLDEDEREVVTLALRFVAEYEAHNDKAILQAHENLKRHYPTGLYYKPEQIQRIQAARQCN